MDLRHRYRLQSQKNAADPGSTEPVSQYSATLFNKNKVYHNNKFVHLKERCAGVVIGVGQERAISLPRAGAGSVNPPLSVRSEKIGIWVSDVICELESWNYKDSGLVC